MESSSTMSDITVTSMPSAKAMLARKKLASNFLRKGITIGIASGISYGLYTAFLALGMTKGVLAEWYGPQSPFSLFVITYLLAALGTAITETTGALWALGYAIARGKVGDVLRCIKTKPGIAMALGALMGGPIATTAYVIALQTAGSISIPIAALCPAIGAILARIFFKQKLSPRICLGIFICFMASFMIASNSLSTNAPDKMFFGICIAFIAAIGWGFEGCVCGYGTALIDSEIGITIRQATSSIANIFILMPIIAFMAGDTLLAPELYWETFTNGSVMIWLGLSGLFGALGRMLWYRGNSMCGSALGMACNGMFSFWAPLLCWLILGVFAGIDGWGMPPIAWIAALIMAAGIFVIAMNPLDLFKKEAELK